MWEVDALVAEALVMEELAPALTAVGELVSAEAGYFRFNRHALHDTGKAMLALGPRADLQAPLTVLSGDALSLPHTRAVVVTRLDDLPFGERGASGLVYVRTEGRFSEEDLNLLRDCNRSFAVANKRIQRFHALLGANHGFAVLVEQRLGACAALASPNGELMWMSQSARALLGDEGQTALRDKLRVAPGQDVTMQLQSRRRIFGKVSLSREAPEASVQYIAVELSSSDAEAEAIAHKLTRSERDVYDLMMQGMSNEEIATSRFVTVDTVRSHIQKIYRKFGVASRLELLAHKT